ncbi:DNA polymerase III subunit delta [Anaerotignum faecicola]|nr:DNA polymerase III subunit delta [Anaerotignum faecicola]
MEKLKEEIKSGKPADCYIFFGEESYLKKLYEVKLKEIFSQGAGADMNINVFEGASDVNAVIDAAETLPFFAEKRLVIVKDSGLFSKGRKNDSEIMAKFINSMPESVCMLFSENKAEKAGALYKAVSKAGRCIEFKTPAESELASWIVSEAKRSRLKIDKKTAVYFIRTVGSGMENASSELKKLISYMPEGSEIKEKDIDEICAKSLESKVFDLVDAIGTRKTGLAVEIYKNLIMAREEPVNILGMISRQFRIMLQCRALIDAGEPQANIAAIIGENPYAVKKCIAQGKNFTPQTLKKAFRECAETNLAIRRGELSDRNAVEILIIKYGN